MNEAERLGRNQVQLARCSLGYSEDIYCLSLTPPASSSLPDSFLDIFAPLLPLCISHPSPDRRQLGIKAVQTSASRVEDLSTPPVAWHALTLGNNSHVMLATANAAQDAADDSRLRPVHVPVCVSSSCLNGEPLPVGGPPLAVLIHLQHDLGGVQRRAGVGVQQKLLVLGQILSWGLLGESGAVQQLSLQQGKVCLRG